MGERQSVARRAWAKVNLALSVHPPAGEPPERRGWHPIEGLFSAIDLADEVEVRRGGGAASPKPDVEVAWSPDSPLPSPIDWPAESDLAWKARLALERETGRELPCSIRVRKRIPVGAGLGGGSSDAAAVLLALDELFELGLGAERLREVGLTLGSDVGFFLDGEDPPRASIVSGFGERIERLGRFGDPLLLILPPVRCSTPAVYRAFDRLGRERTPFDADAARAAVASGSAGGLELANDLGAAALAESPELGEFYSEIELVAGAAPAITGSGSAMFFLGHNPGPLVREAAEGAGGAVVQTRLV